MAERLAGTHCPRPALMLASRPPTPQDSPLTTVLWGLAPNGQPSPTWGAAPWPRSCHHGIGPVSHHLHGFPAHFMCMDFLSLTP